MDERERREKLEKLARLDKIYIDVMYYRFLDKTVPDIAKILNIPNPKTVYTRFTRIFEDLHIEGDEKEQQLIREYSPIFFEFFKSEEDLVNWGIVRAEMLRQATTLGTQAAPVIESADDAQSELPNSETKGKLEGSDSTPERPLSQASQTERPIEPVTRQPANRPPWLIPGVSFLVLCLLCLSALLWGTRILPTLFAEDFTPTEILATEAPASTITPTFIETQPVAPSETSLPTSTHTAAPPTLTGTPTNTPLPTETPTSSVPPLFFDDFNNGKSAEWQLIYGSEPVIVNGSLTFNDQTLMIVDAKDWTDYEISFYVSNMQCQQHVGSRGLTVGMRVQDPNNMVALRINDQDFCGGTWVTIQNNEWNKIPNTDFMLPQVDANGGRQITIRVQGNSFSTPIGTSVVIENFPTGGVALIGAQGVTVDNFRVVPLAP